MNKEAKKKKKSYVLSYIDSYIKGEHGRYGRDLLIFFILTILGICLLLYLFTWVHELSHIIAALITRVPITNIEVYWPFNGFVTLDFGTTILINDEVLRLSITAISGSMGGFLVTLILNRIIYFNRYKRFSIFMPLFGITGYWMVNHELIYWIKGVDYWIRGVDVVYDASVLLDLNAGINPFFLQIFLIIVCCIIVSWLAINFIFVMWKKFEIIRKNAEEWNLIINRKLKI